MSTRTLERPARRATFSGVAVPLVLVAMVVVGAWSVYDLGINPASIINSMENAVAFTGRMFPLDFPPIGELLSLIAETFAIVFLATVLSVLISVPIAVAAASSTARNKLGRGTACTVIVIARAIPDLVLAILFVRVFGLGATAGILAMGIHSVGMVGKLYADAIEELDDGPRTAIESAGTRRSQQLWAAIPQKLMPQLIATALHRFDINLRTSVLLGYVGVGGLGLAIADALRVLDYQRGMALALVVLAICIITELISGTIRAALLGGSHAAKGTWVDRMWGGRREATGTLPPWSVDRVRRVLTFVAVIGLVLWSWSVANISVANLATGVMNLPRGPSAVLPALGRRHRHRDLAANAGDCADRLRSNIPRCDPRTADWRLCRAQRSSQSVCPWLLPNDHRGHPRHPGADPGDHLRGDLGTGRGGRNSRAGGRCGGLVVEAHR